MQMDILSLYSVLQSEVYQLNVHIHICRCRQSLLFHYFLVADCQMVTHKSRQLNQIVTNKEQYEKCLCNQSSGYENTGNKCDYSAQPQRSCFVLLQIDTLRCQ